MALLVAGLVFAIGVILVIILNRQGAGENVGTSDQVMSTELKSGSVTTTIDGKTVTYSAAYVVDGIEAIVSAGEFAATGANQNVFLVINGGKLTIEGDVTIKKSGGDKTSEQGNYGANSAVVVVGEGSSLAMDGAGVTKKRDVIDDGVRIYTDALGANALVATDGGEIVVEHTTIETSGDNSRGLYATYGGEIVADNVIINTKGDSSAALATGQGEGKIAAVNMVLNASGTDSPLIYSNGSNITVTNSRGSAGKAQAVVERAVNSVNLEGCEF